MSEVQNTTAEQSNEEPKPNITIEDIVLTQRVIAQASARAAFKAEEMSIVGGLYDRITRFVNYHVPAAKEEGSAEGEAPTGNEAAE